MPTILDLLDAAIFLLPVAATLIAIPLLARRMLPGHAH